MITRPLGGLAATLWIFAGLCAGCEAEQPQAQAWVPAAEAPLVVHVTDEEVNNLKPGEEMTIDLQDGRKIYMLQSSPLSPGFARVRLVCPNGVVMNMRGWAEMQVAPFYPNPSDVNKKGPVVISGMAVDQVQSVLESLPPEEKSNMPNCQCEVNCQSCQDGATVCTDPSCACGGGSVVK